MAELLLLISGLVLLASLLLLLFAGYLLHRVLVLGTWLLEAEDPEETGEEAAP